MGRVIVRTLGEGLTLPEEILQAVGQPIGAEVEVEVRDGGIFLSSPPREAEAQAQIDEALKRIIERSKTIAIRGLSLKDLINEGRRG